MAGLAFHSRFARVEQICPFVCFGQQTAIWLR
jgi:hypothetical protein